MRSKLMITLGGLALAVTAIGVSGCDFHTSAPHVLPSQSPASGSGGPAAATQGDQPAAAPSADDRTAPPARIPGAADLTTIPGHDLLPPCLPPGFALPEGTEIAQGVDAHGAGGPCSTTGGSFRVNFSQQPGQVTEFLRQTFAGPTWQTNTDEAETVQLIANDGAATGPLPAWTLDFGDDPSDYDPAVGTFGVTFIVFTFDGQTEGQVSYLPPTDETTA